MAISDRITEAVTLMQVWNAEGALIPVCSALDATAKKVFPGQRTTERCIHFLDRNIELISRFTFFGPVFYGQLRQAFSHPELTKGRLEPVPLSDIIYRIVRCGVMHEASLDPSIRFAPDRLLLLRSPSAPGEPLIMPKTIVYGLAMAVVACQENADQRGGPRFAAFGHVIDIASLWGAHDKCIQLSEAIRLARAAEQKAAPADLRSPGQ